MKSEPDMEENDAENRLSESSEERDSKSSKEGSPIDEGYKDVLKYLYMDRFV